MSNFDQILTYLNEIVLIGLNLKLFTALALPFVFQINPEILMYDTIFTLQVHYIVKMTLVYSIIFLQALSVYELENGL